MTIDIIQKIEAILPQTQCKRCGFDSCHAYAVALAANTTEINQCPPGGDAGILQLANLLGKPAIELNPLNGAIKPRQIAIINEETCIGCTLCIKACPVDAILGANKMMHTVIADECSGCDLCLPVCPVDCIVMIDDPVEWNSERRMRAKIRFNAHNERRQAEQLARDLRLKQQSELLKKVNPSTPSSELNNVIPIAPTGQFSADEKSSYIAAIMQKAQEKLKQ